MLHIIYMFPNEICYTILRVYKFMLQVSSYIVSKRNYIIKLFSSKLLTLNNIYDTFLISVFSEKYYFTLCFSLKKGRSAMASFLILSL